MLEGRERWLYAFLAQLLRDGDAPARRLVDASSREIKQDASRASTTHRACTGTAWPRPSPKSWERRPPGASGGRARSRRSLIPPVVLRADGNLAYFEAPRPPPGRFVERI